MSLMQAIGRDIFTQARQTPGVDPYFALGLASREGLNPNTINSPTFGNRDANGYSYGPWQLYSGSPQAGAVAPGGQADEFRRIFGQAPNANNWTLQNKFALGLLSKLGEKGAAKTWYAVGDNGGPENIRRIGHQFAKTLGIDAGEGGGNFSANPSPLNQTPMQSGFQAPASAPQAPPQPYESAAPQVDSIWGRLGNIGNGLTGAGAAIMAINNPAGAAVLSRLARDNKEDPNKWRYAGTTPNGRGMIFQNSAGGVKIDPVPEGYSGPKESDTPSEVRALEMMSKRPDLMETYQQMHPKKGDSKFIGEYAPEEAPQLKILADLYQRDKGSLSRLDQPTRAKLFKYLGDNGVTGGDIAAGQVEQTSNLAAGRKLGQTGVQMDIFSETFRGGVEQALKASADVPRGDWKAWNTVMGMAKDQISDPKWRGLNVATQTAIREYAKALNPSGQPTVSDMEHARQLLSSVDGPEAYKAALDMMAAEVGRTHERLRGLKQNFKEDISGRKDTQSTPEEALAKSETKRLRYNPSTGKIE
jgi:hypothetical protein